MAKRPLQFATSTAAMAHDEFMTNMAQFDILVNRNIQREDNGYLIVKKQNTIGHVLNL